MQKLLSYRCLLVLVTKLIAFTFAIGQDCSSDSLSIKRIKAFATDNQIDFELQNHEVYINTDCEQTDKILVHLVGTFGNPSSTRFFPTLSANNGIRAITLKYLNDVAAVSACADSMDEDCFGNYRREITSGEDVSTLVEVDFENSIENRIQKLLIYLDENFPSERWSDFILDDSSIDWSKVILSGHSQGGGHAAYLGKKYPVDRVIMFASPNDYSDFFEAPANWLNLPSATASSRFYGFANLFDRVVDFEKQLENWDALDLRSVNDTINVDGKFCNYDNSQTLYTRYSSPSGVGNHSSVIVDSAIPLTNDIPLFTPVWEYLLGICGTSSTPISLEDLTPDLSIFPNPTFGTIDIQSDAEIQTIRIINSLGKVLKQVTANANELRLSLDDLKGLIFLNITFDGQMAEHQYQVIVH